MMDITLANLRDSRIIDLLSTHMITARASGLSRLSLETGSWTYFDPARRFYASHGFVECPPLVRMFATYGTLAHSARFNLAQHRKVPI